MIRRIVDENSKTYTKLVGLPPVPRVDGTLPSIPKPIVIPKTEPVAEEDDQEIIFVDSVQAKKRIKIKTEDLEA